VITKAEPDNENTTRDCVRIDDGPSCWYKGICEINQLRKIAYPEIPMLCIKIILRGLRISVEGKQIRYFALYCKRSGELSWAINKQTLFHTNCYLLK